MIEQPQGLVRPASTAPLLTGASRCLVGQLLRKLKGSGDRG